MKTLIIDLNNIGWMAAGIKPLTHNGQRVEVIYVGLNMIRSYIVKFEPDICYVAADGGRDPERMKLYPDYKRRRGELTKVEIRERNGFFSQLNELQKVIKMLGIIQYRCKDREADDIIFNLLYESNESIIVSTDKDFFQTLNQKGVEIYSPVKKQIVRAADVEEKYKIPISYFIDHKALTGDPSDNLPGIRGIGDVGATWLINNVFNESTDEGELSKTQLRMMNLLTTNMDTFELMYELIKLKKIGKEELERGRTENRPVAIGNLQERGIAICQRYGFERHQRNISKFLRPFELLWGRQNMEETK